MSLNTFKHKNLSQNCPHQTIDNKDYINCTKNDSTISYCTNPCPYKITPSNAPFKFLGIVFQLLNLRVLVCFQRNNREINVLAWNFPLPRNVKVVEGEEP